MAFYFGSLQLLLAEMMLEGNYSVLPHAGILLSSQLQKGVTISPKEKIPMSALALLCMPLS